MAWKELFSTDIGLLSVFTIGVVVVMGAYFGIYFNKKMNEKPSQN